MSQNNLEIKNNEETVENIMKKVSDPDYSIDEKEKVKFIRSLNQRLQELQNAIDSVNKDNEEIDRKRNSLEKNMNDIDDDKAEADKKIKKLSKQIETEKIDIEDKSNPIVKRLNSLIEEREAIEEQSQKYQEDGNELDEKKEKNDDKIEKLKEEIERVTTIKNDLKSKSIKEKVEEAEKKAQDRAKTSHEHDPFIVLFDSLLKRHENIKERDKLVEDATSAETRIQEEIESDNAISSGDNEIVENETSTKEKDGICISVVITDKDKNETQVKILTPEEYVNYTNSQEVADLRDKVREQAELQEDKKTVSIVISTHDSKQQLLNKLEPIMKSGIDNPENIGQYATSQTRRNNLIDAIAENAVNTEKMGGTAHDEQFKLAKDKSIHTTIAQKVQPNLKVEKVMIDSNTKKIDHDDIPWKHLKSFNLTKDMLSKENIEILKNGGMTDLITVKGKNKKGEEVTQSFKLSLCNDKKGNYTFRKIPVLPENNVDKRKTLGDEKFSIDDKLMLKKFGQLNHLVPFTSEDGKTRNLMVGLDKETNTLFTCDPNEIRIPKFIQEQCTKEELRKIRNCQPVHLENLKDNAGQRFNGWVVMSPHNNGKLLQLKHIDNEFKAQVRNNNFGERTEKLKEDKDAKVLTKQTESNDGPKVKTTHRKALDFSTDSQGDTLVKDKTIKTTKHI